MPSQAISSYFDHDDSPSYTTSNAGTAYTTARVAFGDQESPATALGYHIRSVTQRDTQPDVNKYRKVLAIPVEEMSERQAGKALYYYNWHLVKRHYEAMLLYKEHGTTWTGYTLWQRVREIKSEVHQALFEANKEYYRVHEKVPGKQYRIAKAKYLDQVEYKRENDSDYESLSGMIQQEYDRVPEASRFKLTLPKKIDNAYSVLRWTF